MLDLQNAEIFRAALESLQTGVCVVDHDRKISYWNDGAEKITGYLRQDVLGRFCGDILLIKSHERKRRSATSTVPWLQPCGMAAPVSRVYIFITSRATPFPSACGRFPSGMCTAM